MFLPASLGVPITLLANGSYNIRILQNKTVLLQRCYVLVKYFIMSRYIRHPQLYLPQSYNSMRHWRGTHKSKDLLAYKNPRTVSSTLK